MTERMRKTLLALFLFVVSLTTYLWNLPYRYWSAGGDTTPAELLPVAIMHGHGLYFDEFAQGATLPHWFTRRDQHVISSYPIIPGLLNVPVYAVASGLGTPLDQAHRSLLSVISASLLTAMSVAFFFLAVSRLTTGRYTAVAAALVYAFGTTAASVAARGMWQHGPSLFFLTAGLYLTLRGNRWCVAIAAIPLGMAVWNRPMNIMIVVPLATYVFWQHRKVFPAFAALAFLPAVAMSWYSWTYWGSIGALGQYSSKGLFSGNMIAGFCGIMFNPSRGLLVFTPLFVFSLVTVAAVLRHPRRDPFLSAIAAGVVLTILLYSKYLVWWGGSGFGYRMLTELVPSLTILMAVGWERIRSTHRVFGAAYVMAGAASVYVNLLGAFMAPCGFDTVPDEINHHLERLWSVRDGEIARCTDKLGTRLATHLK